MVAKVIWMNIRDCVTEPFELVVGGVVVVVVVLSGGLFISRILWKLSTNRIVSTHPMTVPISPIITTKSLRIVKMWTPQT